MIRVSDGKQKDKIWKNFAHGGEDLQMKSYALFVCDTIYRI